MKTSGCSGYAYVIDYAKQPTEADRQIEVDGLTILIDPISEPLLAGTTVDLKTEGVNRTLYFDNPNVVSECGCGESLRSEPCSSIISPRNIRSKFLRRSRVATERTLSIIKPDAVGKNNIGQIESRFEEAGQKL